MSKVQVDGSIRKTLIWGIRLMDGYGTLAIKWDDCHKEFQTKTGNYLKVINFLTWIATIIFLLGVLQVIIYWNETNILVKSYGFMGTSITAAGVFCAHINCRYPDLICGVINNIFKHESRRITGMGLWKSRNKKPEITLVKNTIRHWAISIHVLLFPYIFNIVMNPCSPAYAGYFIVEDCEGNIGRPPTAVFVELKEKILITAVQSLMWLMFYPAVHLHCTLIYVHAYYFCLFIKGYTRALISTRPQERRRLEWVSQGFREIQLMLSQYRYYSAETVVLGIMMGAMGAQVMGQYNFVEYSNKHVSNVPVQILFLSLNIALISVFLLMSGYGYLAKVYKMSRQSSDMVKLNNMDLLKNKWCRRVLRSNPTLKIFFGSQNFLEPQTPLNIEMLAISQTVNLLLLK